MTCDHGNPAGYAFCGTCGGALAHVRCRCGFVAASGDVFCGRCGTSLTKAAAADGQVIVAADHRFNLVRLAKQAAQEKHFLESTHKVRVTQDDIRKLLTKRKRKF